MTINIITIFPELFENFIKTSIIDKAVSRGLIRINVINLRDYSKKKHNQVDDTVFGGGAGMLMAFPPLYEAIKANPGYTILTSPQGKILTQKHANSLSKREVITIVCGHYEGVDARILEFIDEEVSIGDYVLTGGELPAMIISDVIIRCIPEVIEQESLVNDSLYNGLLKHPEYTKPREYEGRTVPSILLSGHHKNIVEYNHQMSLLATKQKRPDLYRKYLKKTSKKDI